MLFAALELWYYNTIRCGVFVYEREAIFAPYGCETAVVVLGVVDAKGFS